MTPEALIDKWSRADRTERQAAQEHFGDLCRVLGEPTPNEAAEPDGYTFEKGATCADCSGARTREAPPRSCSKTKKAASEGGLLHPDRAAPHVPPALPTSVAVSTFTPGPIVDEIATRLM